MTAPDTSYGEGVYWAGAGTGPPAGDTRSDVNFNQNKQFDASTPAAGTWGDGDVFDTFADPPSGGMAALNSSRANARALGPSNAAVLNAAVATQTRQFGGTTLWTGSENVLSALTPNLLPSANDAENASLTNAQALGAGAVSAENNVVLQHQNRQFDPVRNFYDRTSNG